MCVGDRMSPLQGFSVDFESYSQGVALGFPYQNVACPTTVASRLGGRLGKNLFDRLDDLLEGRGVGDGHFGQGLAVQGDLGLVQSVDEFAVAQSLHAHGGVDADDPQLVEVTLPQPAIAIGVDARSDQRFLNRSIQAPTASNVTAGTAEESISG